MQTDLQTLISNQAVPSLRREHIKRGDIPLYPGQGCGTPRLWGSHPSGLL